MAIVLNKVLVPVDFSVNTGLAIKKAVGLAGAEKTVLHLLHVVRSYRPLEALAAKNELDRQAQDVMETHPGLNVKAHVLKSYSVQRMIIECSKMLTPDLIVIGKQNHHRKWAIFPMRRWYFSRHVSPDLLAQRTNCPVLTVKQGTVDSRIRIIVIPIRNFLPERKLEWAVLLARKFKAQVHLLAIQRQEHGGGLPQIFLKAYHHMRENLHHPIEFSTITGDDPVRATLNYAELVMADIILVNPVTESGINGLTGSRHISDLLEKNSKIQVLDVEPI
ncbi:MAG TPA: universal stress protein [Puia sp.]|nr:universal stress protein [Puia sp.]